MEGAAARARDEVIATAGEKRGDKGRNGGQATKATCDGDADEDTSIDARWSAPYREPQACGSPDLSDGLTYRTTQRANAAVHAAIA